jgi:hypothetical protein
MHDGCASDIKNFLKKYDASLKTILPKERPTEKYIITKEKADELWNLYNEDFLNSDVLIFSDTIPFSRPVLENLESIPKNTKIILWVTNRFNYAIESDQSYYDLLDRVKNDYRIYFLYSNKFEKVYLNNFVKIPENKQFFFTPYGKRSRIDFNFKNKKDHNQKLFVMSYQNEKEFYPLFDELNNLDIDFYCKKDWIPNEEYCGPYDIETCSAVLHIPYAWGTIALWEYMSLGKTFILPSLAWLNRTYQERYLFFQTNKSIDMISIFSDWYCKENENLFVYFDEISQIKDIIQNKQMLINKGKLCFKKVQESNLINHAIFENIINL